MDITVVDFFRSKYIMGHPDILDILDVAIVDKIKHDERILSIHDSEERKHAESLSVWDSLSPTDKWAITHLFTAWVGDDTDEKSITLNTDTEKVHKYSEDTVCDNRKLVGPIYVSAEDKKILSLISGKNPSCDNIYDTYRSVFKCIARKKQFYTVWGCIHTHQYNDVSVMSFNMCSNIFTYVTYYKRVSFKEEFSLATNIVHNALLHSGIYNDYPTFHDYKNLATHVVLRGEVYCTNAVMNPETVRYLIEYKEYHDIWDYYIKAM